MYVIRAFFGSLIVILVLQQASKDVRSNEVNRPSGNKLTNTKLGTNESGSQPEHEQLSDEEFINVLTHKAFFSECVQMGSYSVLHSIKYNSDYTFRERILAYSQKNCEGTPTVHNVLGQYKLDNPFLEYQISGRQINYRYNEVNEKKPFPLRSYLKLPKQNGQFFDIVGLSATENGQNIVLFTGNREKGFLSGSDQAKRPIEFNFEHFYL